MSVPHLRISEVQVIQEHQTIRRRRLRGLIIVLSIVLLFIIGNRILYGARGKTYHNELVQEFNQLPPPPGAVLVGSEDWFTPWGRAEIGSVGARYNSQFDFAELRSYYERQLDSRGWQLVDDGTNRAMLGGGTFSYVAFCKGPYQLVWKL